MQNFIFVDGLVVGVKKLPLYRKLKFQKVKGLCIVLGRKIIIVAIPQVNQNKYSLEQTRQVRIRNPKNKNDPTFRIFFLNL